MNNWTELNKFCHIMYAAAPNDAIGSRYVCAIQTPNDVFFCPNACPAVIELTPAIVLGAAAGLINTS